ncbi:unnamed protein product [Mytilus edulis]|uniref:Uncharacterized protein n=1 Tax=Mytilus edulis TaxID=6550 RepID=A0A8S3R0Z2_MYTED|nr:unnamed protein product [Mytilus edulis]
MIRLLQEPSYNCTWSCYLREQLYCAWSVYLWEPMYYCAWSGYLREPLCFCALSGFLRNHCTVHGHVTSVNSVLLSWSGYFREPHCTTVHDQVTSGNHRTTVHGHVTSGNNCTTVHGQFISREPMYYCGQFTSGEPLCFCALSGSSGNHCTTVHGHVTSVNKCTTLHGQVTSENHCTTVHDQITGTSVQLYMIMLPQGTITTVHGDHCTTVHGQVSQRESLYYCTWSGYCREPLYFCALVGYPPGNHCTTVHGKFISGNHCTVHGQATSGTIALLYMVMLPQGTLYYCAWSGYTQGTIALLCMVRFLQEPFATVHGRKPPRNSVLLCMVRLLQGTIVLLCLETIVLTRAWSVSQESNLSLHGHFPGNHLTTAWSGYSQGIFADYCAWSDYFRNHCTTVHGQVTLGTTA